MKSQLFAPLGEAVLLSQAEERIKFKRLAGAVNAGTRDGDTEATELCEKFLHRLMRPDTSLLERERPLCRIHRSPRIPTGCPENVHYVRREICFHTHSPYTDLLARYPRTLASDTEPAWKLMPALSVPTETKMPPSPASEMVTAFATDASQP